MFACSVFRIGSQSRSHRLVAIRVTCSIMLAGLFILCTFGGCSDDSSAISDQQKKSRTARAETYETKAPDLTEHASAGNHREPRNDLFNSKDDPVLELPAPEIPRGGNLDPSRDMATVAREASQYIELVVQLFPNDTDALEVQARFFLLLGKLDVAKGCWEKSLELNPLYGYAYTGLGMIAMRESSYGEAIGRLERAIALLPGEQNAARELSNAYLRNGQIDQAIRVLQDQLQHKEDAFDTWQLLGQARMANREYSAAKEAFARSLELNPSNYLAQQGLSAALLRLGERAEAMKWMKLQESSRSSKSSSMEVVQAAERSDISDKLTQAARVLLKHNRKDLALKTLEYARGCSVSNEESRSLLVSLLAQEKSYENALQLVAELTALSPKNANYWLTAGSIATRNRQLSVAEEMLNRVIELLPQRVEGYLAMAEAHILLDGDKQKAMEMAGKVVEIRGTSSDYATYAQTLAMNNRLEESISALERAVEKDPEADNYKKILEQLRKERSAR
jgi:tetratricopeptide (TPR) repeat protein